MKRRTAGLLCCLVAGLLAAAPAHAAGPRAVRVGVFQVEPLLFMSAEGPQGFCVDLLEEVARLEGWQLSYLPGSWEENLDRLARGEIDILPTMAYAAERDSFADFSHEQLIMMWSQIFVRPEEDIRNVLDLSGRRVAIMKGDINGENFRAYVEPFGLECEYVEIDSLGEVFMLTAAAEVAAGVAPNVYGYAHARSYGLKASPIIFAPYATYFAVPQGRNADLLAAVDDALRAWRSGEESYLQSRMNYWFGGSQFERPTVPRWLLVALGAVGGIALLLVLWVRILNHQVGRQTRKLARSEQRFRTLFESAGDGIFILDEGRFVDCNAKTLELFRISRDQIIDREPADVSPPRQPDGTDSRTAAHARIAAAAAGDQSVFAWRHRRPDETEFDAEVTLTAFHLGGHDYMQAILRDVTERRELEADLRQAQKMEAIGTLAGGIAHDFNNILSAILGYGELARLDAGDNAELRENLDHVLRAGERARDLVQQILAFSRRGLETRQPIEIAPIVTETLQLLRSSIPATITITHELASPGPVLADPTSVHQIIMNLCTNAYQAMAAAGGELRVTLREQGYGCGDGARTDHQVVLEVRDTGPGMDAATREKIFEPYFTTKSAERGTGLGLAVVHGIVEEHGGRIEVESAPGAGALFRVCLPRRESAAFERDEAGPEPISVGTESVLLVDDEPEIVDSCVRGLERLGYRVTGCGDPLEALALFRAVPDAYDILVTDMTMADMTGVALAAAIREIRPELPIVLCTGYSDGVSAAEARELGITAFVLKPLGVSSLAARIREALSRSPV